MHFQRLSVEHGVTFIGVSPNLKAHFLGVPKTKVIALKASWHHVGNSVSQLMHAYDMMCIHVYHMNMCIEYLSNSALAPTHVSASWDQKIRQLHKSPVGSGAILQCNTVSVIFGLAPYPGLLRGMKRPRSVKSTAAFYNILIMAWALIHIFLMQVSNDKASKGRDNSPARSPDHFRCFKPRPDRAVHECKSPATHPVHCFLPQVLLRADGQQRQGARLQASLHCFSAWTQAMMQFMYITGECCRARFTGRIPRCKQCDLDNVPADWFS